MTTGRGSGAVAGAGRSLERALWRETSSWPIAERLHLLVRRRSAPWARILARLPRDGSLLDVGCGSGLLAWLLARSSFAGTYLGLDPDARKVDRARRWPLPEGSFRFEATSSAGATRAAFRHAALVDVLYLVSPAGRAEFLSSVAGALAPGGRLTVVTSGGGPGWKRTLDRLQERTAVSLGITRGEAVAPCDGEEAARLLREAGFSDVVVEDVGDGYLHGFELSAGTRGVSSAGN